MSSSKVSLPDAPSFQTDPDLGWSKNFLKGQSDWLIKGLTTDGGSLSGLLGETVQFNPEITRLAIEQMKSQLAPSYRTGRQDLINTLEANNQLTGSTTGSSLANYENDYLSQLTATGAQAAINDINRALNTRVNLYGTGLNAASGVGSMALSNQEQMNQFAIQNYENQVASALANQDNKGGWAGALSGAAGGAMAGSAFGPWGMAIGAGLGGFSGYQGQSGSGGQWLGAGASLAGSRAGNSAWRSPSTFSTGSELIHNPIYDWSPYGSSSSTLARWGF